ncbi:MAG: insulinase family protein, partial [Epsilonproteobacteria bacterium]|nr:insulinase family protein [Campylobacterota bacterium]
NLTAKALGNVKSTTLGSLSRKENDYDYVASNQLKAILYEGTVLAQSASGTKESVEAIKLEDVKAFLAEHLVSSRLMIAIGGDLNEALVNEQLQKILDAMPKGSDEPLVSYEVRKEAKEVILKRETEQAYIYFGSPFHIKESDSDYYKSRVAAFILGAGGFGSRLMEEIRVKRGLAYSAYGRINASQSNSHFSGYLQTKIESLEEAQKTVRDVIADFVKNGVSKEELEQTKKFMLGSEPLRVETMSQRLNRTLMEFYKGQEFGHSAKELELIKGLSLKELNEFIASHVEINDLSFAIVTK